MNNDIKDYLSRIVLPAINKYGFYFNGMEVNYKKMPSEIGVSEISEFFGLNLLNDADRLTAICFKYLIDEHGKTLLEIRKSDAQNTFPPAFQTLIEFGIIPTSKGNEEDFSLPF